MNKITTRHMAFNSILNLIGQLVPMAIGFFTIPKIIISLGQERFALLTLAWMALGYFTFFDLGLGRAIIKLIADKIAEDNRKEVPGLFWSSIIIILILSGFMSVLGSLVGPYLVTRFMQIPIALLNDALHAVVLLSLSIPLITLTAGVKGVLEAEHCFAEINILQILLGAYTYISPLLLADFTITNVVKLLILGRVVNLALHVYLVLKKFPELRKIHPPSKKYLPMLFSFGGWMTVSNVVGPIMVYFDRFFLSALVPIGEVAFYTAPYEIISRLLIIPSAIARVMFPAFATTKIRNEQQLLHLYKKSIWANLLLLGLPLIVLSLAAKWGLAWWLGPEYGARSTIILQILAVGIFFNGIAWMPFTLLQSVGRAGWTAKVHLLELPIYLVALFTLIKSNGIQGAAIAWTFRVVLDTLVMFSLAHLELKTRKV